MLHVALAVTRCFDNSISHALLNHQGWFVSQCRFSEVESLAHKFSNVGREYRALEAWKIPHSAPHALPPSVGISARNGFAIHPYGGA